MPSDRAFRSVCVFCGSSSGFRSVYKAAAADLGRLLANRGIRLVYGGGHVGLMGVVADSALAAGGEVTGVMPQALIDREIGHNGLTEMRIVTSMHERKALMADLSDAFIALPGGHGTLDEFCEILTWAQLGIHAKPCGILNVAGYYDPLLEMFSRAVEEGFLKAVHRDMILVDGDPVHLLERMGAAGLVSMDKWSVTETSSPVP
ncbi:MAG: TIGR00730 family Rossman fold protein [Bryobacteraceae bacterium]